MTSTKPHPFGQHYAFVVVGVIFFCLLASAGVRSSMSVMMEPLEAEFGWRRDMVSMAASIGIFIYGLVGPFAAALMDRVGLRRTLMGALLLMSAATALSLLMGKPWHLVATWGLMSGMGTGAVATVLGATIVTRWFKTNRGLMMGLMSASAATGLLIFLPFLAHLSESGWRPVAITVSIVTAALAPLVWLLVPERPSSIGVTRFGADGPEPEAPAVAEGFLARTFGTLFEAAKMPIFWLLFATFFICGFTTNGLVGTHLINYCGDMNITRPDAAWYLAAMGVFDLIGTTGSGWLTDRYDPRKLLGVYYGVRGLALILLPLSGFTPFNLMVFAMFYGLDWIATVPPTLRLANQSFGDRSGPLVFGWIVAGHQVGAAAAAWLAGVMREVQGNYDLSFQIAGFTALAAAVLAMMIAPGGQQPARSSGGNLR